MSDSNPQMTNTGGRIGTKPEPGLPLWLVGGALLVFMVAISIAIVVSAFSGTGCHG